MKEIGTDELGQPTINGKKLLSFRIAKNMPEKSASTFSEGDIVDYFLQHHRKPARPSSSHADLRLGYPGKPLESWAIPKERLPEPGEKLLAPGTTPHEYGYGRFSGKFGKGRNASEVELLESGQAAISGSGPGVMTFSIKDGDKTRQFALIRMKTGKKWLIIGQNPKKPAISADGSENGAKTASEMVKTVEVPLKLVSKKLGTRAEVLAEVADTPQKRSKGLSGRTDLPEKRGMFFDVPGPFWMKGVNMPLDIIFLDKSGSVLDFDTMEVEDPRTKADSCTQNGQNVGKSAATCKQNGLKLYKSSSPDAAYALEVPAGWAKQHNVGVGDHVETA